MVPIVLQYHVYTNCFIKLFRSAPLILRTADSPPAVHASLKFTLEQEMKPQKWRRDYRFFYVLLTVHLSIFILVINQLDAQFFFILQ